MSELAVALEWVERARELLKKRKLAAVEQEMVDVREGLLKFTGQTDVQQKLAPELTQALNELAVALESDHDMDAEPSPEARQERQLYEDFRREFEQMRRSLAKLLQPSEASTLDLALALAANQARLQQFGPALTLLQQAWHRGQAILKEGREGRLAESPPDEAEEERLKRQHKAKEAYLQASSKIADLMAKLDPMTRPEQMQCSVFFLMVQQQLKKDLYEDALIVLGHWDELLQAALKKDLADDGAKRLARKRRQDEAEQKAEREERALQDISTKGVAESVEAIRLKMAQYEATLRKILERIVTQWNDGAPHRLEGLINALKFEVERQLAGLKGPEPKSEEERQISVRLLARADLALQAMRDAEATALNMLRESQEAFREHLKPKKDKLDSFVAEKEEAIDKQDLIVEDRRKKRDDHETRTKELTDSSGKKITTPFNKPNRDFYPGEIVLLEPKENPGKNKPSKLTPTEEKRLRIARQMVAATRTYDQLDSSLGEAQKDLDKLKDELEKGRKPLQEDLDKDKKVQTISWDALADIVHGTPLDATQLKATLSHDSGTIEYFAGSDKIVPGKTVLLAGAGQMLRAEVRDSDLDLFRPTVPKQVPINVTRARLTLNSTASIEYGFGTPFKYELLKLGIVTDPPSDDDRSDLLAALNCKVDGEELKPDVVLDAKAHTIAVSRPETRNFLAAAEVVVQLTVKPAQQVISWEGAAPTTMSYGTPLDDKQLNAKVGLSTKPALPDRLQGLTDALVYTDDKGQPVKVGSLLAAGDERRITVHAPAQANFLAAEPKTVVFKVEKAERVLGVGAPEPIGAVVQSSDLRKLRAKFPFTKGKGEQQFFIGPLELTIGAKAVAGKNLRLRVAAKADDNYQPTADVEARIDVFTAAEKFDSAKQSRTKLLENDTHSAQRRIINEIKQQYESLGKGASDEERFAKLNRLIEEIDEIDGKLKSWQGPVPDTSPKGDGKLLAVTIDKTDDEIENKNRTVDKTVEEVIKLVKHGGMTLANIEKLVPSGTSNSYRRSDDYPKGFKYEWRTPSGVEIVVYGHGPTVADNVNDQSDSKKGNLVRVMIDDRYLRPNGTLTGQATDASSHMALY